MIESSRLFFLKSAILICALGAATVVQADERIGTFALEDVHLRATFISHEDEGSEFDLDDSHFALSWKKNAKLSAYFAVGSELARNLPIYYAEEPEDRFGVIEGYAQYEGVYGRLRFGLLPLDFGYDGALAPHRRVFSRARPYSERLIGLRDYGVSFYTEHRGYYTQLTGHNGEVDTLSDGRLWASANWGYSNNRDFRVQASLQTGSVKGTVSSGATHTLAGVVNGESAQWRNGLLFGHWYPRGWNVVVQFGGGEVVQDEKEGRYSSHTVEVIRYFSKNFGAGIRYDEFDPNRKVGDDRQTDTSLALVATSEDSTSSVILTATKSLEEGHEKPDDQLRLVWLLTPYSR